ncbi:hypothetical protein GCM10027425_33140 [Alteromonas gracilis]
MTTASTALAVSGAVVLRAGAVTLVAGLAVAGATAVIAGSPQAWGVAVAAGLVTFFFSAGATMVGAALRMAPGAAMLMALMTYALQMILIFMVFLALNEGGLLGSLIDPVWLTFAIAGLTVVWTALVMRAFRRARITAYDDAPPSHGTRASQGSEGPEAGA